ncbi:4337_t:CDS:2 [Ambispora gerdemannii]|uniref:4337_t:CDS:1 n=1 Tax=Ambispora gerdemannii TaxID=144530 RepID=A0A9N9G3E5_9GLOM|nr:4337_t:CDS:2 [Ambispora gerdemannii]
MFHQLADIEGELGKTSRGIRGFRSTDEETAEALISQRALTQQLKSLLEEYNIFEDKLKQTTRNDKDHLSQYQNNQDHTEPSKNIYDNINLKTKITNNNKLSIM